MSIGQMFLPEFEHEMASTRRAIERVPPDKFDWKAHEKLNTIGWVANHLVDIAGWVQGILQQDSWDINPPDGEPQQSLKLTTVEELLALFDENVTVGKSLLPEFSDEAYMQPWSLMSGGNVIFTLPKVAVIRTWVLNHTIHHRAFLCSYLALNDVPVPGMYGPSADEQG